MMISNDVEKLLILLDEPLIQKKIKQIAVNGNDNISCEEIPQKSVALTYDGNNIEIDRYEKLITNLEAENSRQKEDIEDLSFKLNECEIMIKSIIVQRDEAIAMKELAVHKEADAKKQKNDLEEDNKILVQQLVDLNRELSNLKMQLALPLLLYQKYCLLPQSILDALKGVLTTENVLKFTISGVQWENIQGLEDYILANIDMRILSLEELSKLKEIFDGLFFLYCNVNEKCRRLKTKIGEEFDLDFHTKGPGSKGVSGKIEAVLFDGYVKGNYTKKSVVLIEG